MEYNSLLEHSVEIIVPLALFLLIFACVVMPIRYSYRAKRDMHETVRQAMEKGQDVSPALIEALKESKSPGRFDRRVGILGVFIGAAIIIRGLVVFETDMITGGIITLFIGIGFLVNYRLQAKDLERIDAP